VIWLVLIMAMTAWRFVRSVMMTIAIAIMYCQRQDFKEVEVIKVNLVDLATKYLLEWTDFDTEKLWRNPEIVLLYAYQIRHWMDNHPKTAERLLAMEVE